MSFAGITSDMIRRVRENRELQQARRRPPFYQEDPRLIISKNERPPSVYRRQTELEIRSARQRVRHLIDTGRRERLRAMLISAIITTLILLGLYTRWW